MKRKWWVYAHHFLIFTSVDPLAEKYYSVSPYAYCAGNPVNRVDPNGKLIEFASNVSQSFKDKFTASVKFMKSKGTDGFLKSLNSSKKVYYLAETKGGVNEFKPGSSEILWNPNLAKVTTKGASLSPTTLLNHEFDHANQSDKNPTQFAKDTDPITGFDSQYDSKEEKRVIEGSEQDTAKKNGDIQEGEVTRTDHDVIGYTSVDDPNSNGSATTTGSKNVNNDQKKQEKNEENK